MVKEKRRNYLMFKCTDAYLYREATVVLSKSDVKNADEKDFRPVSLYVPAEFIKKAAKELEQTEEEEQENV